MESIVSIAWAERIRRFKLNASFPGISLSHVSRSFHFRPFSVFVCIILTMNMLRNNSSAFGLHGLIALILQLQAHRFFICISKAKHIWMLAVSRKIVPSRNGIIPYLGATAWFIFLSIKGHKFKQARAANH